MKATLRYRWSVVAVFFAFMLLHQADKLLIGPLATPIMDTFEIREDQFGMVASGALLVGAIFYPLWGYLYDRYARAKLLALAALIWGSTTWLSAIAPTFPTFLATRASTGVDDSSYPGLYSLVADYFGPRMRGKVYGLLQLSQPLGYLVGMVAALMLAGLIGWRSIYYITGTLGLVLAVVILLAIREVPRGQSEPELAELELVSTYTFDKAVAKGLFRKKSLLLLFAQGFIGVFPWNVISIFFFRYLDISRGYSETDILVTMGPAVIVLAAGYFVGGWLGDILFRRTRRGRVLVAVVGVLTGAILLIFTMTVPVENQGLFFVMLMLTAIFIPFASPNVTSTVYDVTLPEVRSTALAIQYFMENIGAALSPWLAGVIAVRYSLHSAILYICVIAWLIGAILLAFAAYLVPRDIEVLRQQMRERAAKEKTLQAASSV